MLAGAFVMQGDLSRYTSIYSVWLRLHRDLAVDYLHTDLSISRSLHYQISISFSI